MPKSSNERGKGVVRIYIKSNELPVATRLSPGASIPPGGRM